MSKNLLYRITVALVAIPVILWIAYRGGEWLFGMVLLFAIIGISEYMAAEGITPRSVFFWLGLFTVILTLFISSGYLKIYELMPVVDNNAAALLMLLLLFFAMTSKWLAMGRQSPEFLFRRNVHLFWGVVYVGMLYSFVFLVGQGHNTINGGDALLLVFCILWVTDTSAMGLGKWLGKHRLAPAVSPNKTVEGFIGGILGGIGAGTILYFWKFTHINFIHILFLSLGCSVSGQIGDLVESMWKRSINIKDSSNIIPGHGGIMDRFDSLLFAAPFMYLYFNLFL